MKEVGDAQRIRNRIMDCCETATFKDQSDEEKKRLLDLEAKAKAAAGGGAAPAPAAGGDAAKKPGG